MNKSSKTKKTLSFRASLLIKSHSTLLFAMFAGCFLLLPNLHGVHAGFWDTITTPSAWINALIYPFFLFFSWIVNLAAGIFVWVIDAATFTKLMNAGAIYEVWLIVRDFLNIFFILVLLFSAFATIFQLDRYEYKKTIPMLVIMALLVNFSFPIARFVIDLANVPMYFFSQNIFGVDGPNEITSGILSGTKMQNILIPGIDDKSLTAFSTTHLLAATICMFLFGISFLVLSVLMLVRMIALAILVMFSPIGFVGMITPALQGFAKGWWDKLFKWAFYGPIAVMFVLVSVIVMKSAGDSIYPTAGAGGVFQSTGNSVNDNMISAVAFFTIPIVLFWIAITSAEKYSNDMSGMSVKFGSQLGRKAGGWVRKGAWGTTKWAAKAPLKAIDNVTQNRISGTTLGIRDAWRNRQSAWWGGSDIENRRKKVSDDVASSLKRKGTSTQEVQKKVAEHEKENTTEADLRELVRKNGDIAAAMVLVKQGKLTDEEFAKVRVDLDDTKDKALVDLLEGKVKEKRIDLVMNYKINQEATELMKRSPGMSREAALARVGESVAEKEIKKLAPSKWKEQSLKDWFSLKDAAGKEIDYDIDDSTGVIEVKDKVTGAVIHSEGVEILRAKVAAARTTFGSYHGKNKDKAIDDMTGEKFTIGQDLKIFV
ncbi:MAG: hypothetical protein WBC29_00980 [Candidatus Moraniibacteriota bacterium]